MFERILVPTDGSPESERAIPVAQQIAAAHGAEVLLAQVVQHPQLSDEDFQSAELYQQLLDTLTSTAQANLAILAARFKSSGVRVAQSLLFGSPAFVLMGIEETQHPDLVVMSTHGRTGLARFALGSVADRLVREGTTPVLVVRQPALPANLATALLMLDGSGVAEQALPMIEALADHPIRAVKLFRAVTDPWDVGAAGSYLMGVADRLAQTGLKTETLVDLGEPTLCIERAAREADLVVLCTHGRGGFDRFRHGSVAEGVVRQVEKPVLLVRAGMPSPITSPSEAEQLATR